MPYMNTAMIWEIRSTGPDDTERLGEVFGRHLTPPAILELRSDLGGGKTTFTRGLARGLGSNDPVSSPTFTISKVYKAKNVEIHHFDFYRLSEPGIIQDQLEESLSDTQKIIVIEWSDIVRDALPGNRVSFEFKLTANDSEERDIRVSYTSNYADLIGRAQIEWMESRP
jgi:tRNA threonylcarbamoyladenosine biosynthesis protein TsaE